jgi:redox-sensitive bicupin YhaK (pirin superfamily)
MNQARKTQQILKGHETSDGAGVKLRRYIGTRELMVHDPFLMLDAFYSDDPDSYLAGFPNHPHRGFETVTYLIQGKMEHSDSRGNRGLLEPGGAQFMRAGSGIIHSEMPRQENGLMWGYQLWVNLPAALKMAEPRYQDLQAHEIPLVQTPAYTAKVLSGNLGGVQGAARGFYPIDYFDVQFKPGQSADIPVAADRSVFAIVVEGSGVIGERSVNRGDLAILGEGDVVCLAADDALRVIIVAGSPIREPVARYGPFVMNTPQEIEQAFVDYQAGRFGVAAGS